MAKFRPGKCFSSKVRFFLWARLMDCWHLDGTESSRLSCFFEWHVVGFSRVFDKLADRIILNDERKFFNLCRGRFWNTFDFIQRYNIWQFEPDFLTYYIANQTKAFCTPTSTFERFKKTIMSFPLHSNCCTKWVILIQQMNTNMLCGDFKVVSIRLFSKFAIQNFLGFSMWMRQQR